VEKIEAQKEKWAAIYEKSTSTRRQAIANLELSLQKKLKMQEQIDAKNAKMLASFAKRIETAQSEVGQTSEEAAQEREILAEIEAENAVKEFYAGE